MCLPKGLFMAQLLSCFVVRIQRTYDPTTSGAVNFFDRFLHRRLSENEFLKIKSIEVSKQDTRVRRRHTEFPPQGGPAPHKVGYNAGLYRWPCAKANSSLLVSMVSLMYEKYSLSALYTPASSLCQHPNTHKMGRRNKDRRRIGPGSKKEIGDAVPNIPFTIRLLPKQWLLLCNPARRN